MRYVHLEWSDETLPVHAFLVESESELLLVDTGQSAAAATRGFLPRWHPFIRTARFELTRDDEVASQLPRLGFDMSDVNRVVLTHLHTDHIGGLGAFPHADIVLSEEEWRLAQGLGGRLRGYVPRQWPNGREPTLVRLTGDALGPFRSSLALGDDIVLVALPGHTRGHIGVLVGGVSRALIIGDAAHTAAELDRVAPAVAEYCRRESIRVLAAHDDAVPAVVDLEGTPRPAG